MNVVALMFPIMKSYLERYVYKKINTEHTISFENVSFAYANNENIFENLNLEIPYGNKIIITGKNGSGKSTFIDILLNLADIKNGEVKISNIKIDEIEPKILYEIIGVWKIKIFEKDVTA